MNYKVTLLKVKLKYLYVNLSPFRIPEKGNILTYNNKGIVKYIFIYVYDFFQIILNG